MLFLLDHLLYFTIKKPIQGLALIDTKSEIREGFYVIYFQALVAQFHAYHARHLKNPVH